VISAELRDQLLAGTDAAAALDQGGLLDSLIKALAKRALNAEMDYHLGSGSGCQQSQRLWPQDRAEGHRQDRDWRPARPFRQLCPQLIAKYQRRFPGFDDKIISIYARGMSTREITGHLRELYGIDVSPDLISTVTDAVLGQRPRSPSSSASASSKPWRRNVQPPARARN
jgi:putative transposase